ncbi:DUF1302 domain-containing protein [Alteromonas lipolytica]|uniref:DUF1302 domain-containing protein n=1 Tax=Alteromonas lipolytica TaxID=1856405 RepID=A0A1E8FGS4_9ALTE|nr:DUF1302 domain-containing protein [Alteromonas lipolytica]OFI35157.1 hypothetical protein BFC17_16570 [Alteromonas lipolytica]GGF57201.1 hypothetical protein GCM10011338_06800 [Alteromonas lipolytica]
MITRLSAFKKSPIAAGVFALFGAAAIPAGAASWDFGDVSVSLDTNLTLATSIRVEDRDYKLIGNSSHPQFNWSGYNAATNIIYPSADVWGLADGAYSSNGDLGNLSYDSGEAFSTQISGNHELDIRYGDVGFFARGFWFYDFEQMDNDRPWANAITGQTTELCDDSKAKELLCTDIRLLDAFFYGDWWIGDNPLTVRVGRQVVSWGESTFIQHGINTTNPVDVTRARTPGAELKEVFIPVGMVFAQLGITDNVSISAYYQYEWERSWLPVAGSYFATNDFAGEGGQANNIQLGFTGNPDIDLNFLMSSLNGIGDALRAGGNPAALGQAYLAYPTKVAIRGYSDAAHVDADDQGQYGVRLTWFAESLNETELSFYHINYHSQRPLISGETSNFTGAAIAEDLAFIATHNINRDNITELQAFTEAKFYYPEDIKLYGFSFNTNIGTTALAGEFAYRQDEPLQIDDVELLYMGMPEQLANAGLRPDLGGISQLNNIGRAVGPGETAQGYVFSDTWQAQFTVSHVFGPALGTDNLILLGEAGYVNIVDFPDPSVVRLNAPGTGRTPSLEPTETGNPRTGLHTGLSNGPETNPFATDDAWGYRLLAVADHNNVFAGINLRTRVTFSHDVKGTTPDPLFLFTEDTKSANISFTFDYLSKWSATASYSAFWGGIGTTNLLSDRDFVSFNIKYAI